MIAFMNFLNGVILQPKPSAPIPYTILRLPVWDSSYFQDQESDVLDGGSACKNEKVNVKCLLGIQYEYWLWAKCWLYQRCQLIEYLDSWYD